MNNQANFQNQPGIAQGSDPTFANVPYDQRWEPLRPTIIRLYMEEKERIPRVAERMKNEYNFSAVPSQYRYHFKKWGIKKRITTEEKEAIINAHGKRLRPGSSLSQVSIDEGGYNKSVDKKVLKRYIRDSIRHAEDIQVDYGMLLRWNLPYSALLHSLGLPQDQSSPFGSGPRTPENITIHSPASHASTGQSPTTQMVQRKLYIDRAKLLLQGREMDLMKQLNQTERETTVTWLHERWLYSFMTAKYWGKGPKHWTAQTIEFKTGSNKRLLGSPSLSTSHQGGQVQNASILRPRSECHWVIHHHGDNYEALPDLPDDDPDRNYDIEDESTWPIWASNTGVKEFSETVNEGLESNTFSKYSNDDVPLSIDALSQQRRKSDRQQKQEELGFAIMSRNVDLLCSLLDSDSDVDVDLAFDVLYKMKAMHLAATYLDGSRQCCLIMDELRADDDYDHFGHTVLDTIFITILRSHTKVTPGVVSKSFQTHTRFAGEDVDICGRWDVDSPCIRELYASGQSQIPFDWKHEFCHTSVQTICHTITNLFLRDHPLDINGRSGLFKDICQHCGHESSAYPLHALVLTAFHLANEGTKRETLFGALAGLVCLLWCGANPFLKASISPPGRQTCEHQHITPLELAESIPQPFISKWSETVRTGWSVFVLTLRYISTQHDFRSPYEDSPDQDLSEYLPKLPPHELSLKHWHGLGQLWGAIQTEFLTYRKLTEVDGALSPRFNMNTLLQGLQVGRGPINIGLIEGDMMNKIDDDGFFVGARRTLCPVVNDVCREYFANIEQWGRINFIGMPGRF